MLPGFWRSDGATERRQLTGKDSLLRKSPCSRLKTINYLSFEGLRVQRHCPCWLGVTIGFASVWDFGGLSLKTDAFYFSRLPKKTGKKWGGIKGEEAEKRLLRKYSLLYIVEFRVQTLMSSQWYVLSYLDIFTLLHRNDKPEFRRI